MIFFTCVACSVVHDCCFAQRAHVGYFSNHFVRSWNIAVFFHEHIIRHILSSSNSRQVSYRTSGICFINVLRTFVGRIVYSQLQKMSTPGTDIFRDYNGPWFFHFHRASSLSSLLRIPCFPSKMGYISIISRDVVSITCLRRGSACCRWKIRGGEVSSPLPILVDLTLAVLLERMIETNSIRGSGGFHIPRIRNPSISILHSRRAGGGSGERTLTSLHFSGERLRGNCAPFLGGNHRG